MKVKYKEQEINIPEGATIEVVNGDLVITPKNNFKDGDVLVFKDERDCVFIYKASGRYTTSYYISRWNTKELDIEGITEDYALEGNKEVDYATESESKLLFDALDKAGKKWNAETKQIEDILKVGDICIFYENECKDQAIIGVLLKTDNSDLPYMDNDYIWHRNAIKFESIEQYEKFIKQ